MTALYLSSSAASFLYGPLALAASASAVPGSSKVISIVFDEEGHDTSSLHINGKTVEGTDEIVRALADECNAWGEAPRNLVEPFLTLASTLSTLTAFADITSALDSLDDHLALRTFLVGHTPIVADWSVWGALKGNTVTAGVLKRGQHPHVSRWMSHLESFGFLQAALASVIEARSNKTKSSKKASAASSFSLGLPGAAEGKVVTRFPPEPSGYLHIGHAKAAMLNQYFARMYKGKLIIRFDDTNPSKEKSEFEDSILEDLALLDIHGDIVSHTSDWFDKLHELAVQLIKEGKAYADDTDSETMRNERGARQASKNRDMGVEDTLARFDEMTRGTEEGKRWCLRARMNYDDVNGALRDPVIYRCNDTPHHRTGTKWKTYPTYDFACPLVDSLEGVTHALRTNEYRDRNPQYQWFLDNLHLRNVHVWDFSRISFIYTLLSKRKLHWFVNQGLVEGWDDPRFPTVRGIRRRGLTVEGLQQFILAQGPSQSQLLLEWDSIWATNKKVIDPIAPRFWAIGKDNAVKVTVNGVAGTEVKTLPKHKKNPEVGEKKTVYSPEILVEQGDALTFDDNEEITLMDWGNAFVRSKTVSPAGEVTALTMDLHLEGDFKKTKKKITWLSVPTTEHPLVDVTLKDYDYLITKKKLDEEDKVEDFVTARTEFRVEAWADANVLDLQVGGVMQFERKGYYILDAVKEEGGKKRLEFVHIPDGRAAGLASKAGVADAAAAPKEDTKPKKEKKAAKPAPVDGAVDSPPDGKPKKEKKAAKPAPPAAAVDPAPAPAKAPPQTDGVPGTRIALADGDSGFPIPVPTALFVVLPIYGEKAIVVDTGSKMHKVGSVYGS